MDTLQKFGSLTQSSEPGIYHLLIEWVSIVMSKLV
jgi:hypothetical protein